MKDEARGAQDPPVELEAQDSGDQLPGPKNPARPGPDTTARISAMKRAIGDAERVIVLTHDNPDPDAIASAAGLGFLLEKATGLPVTLAFGGIVGRAENRALLEELGLDFERVESLEFPPSAAVALVDTQPRAGNNSLPPGQIATIVIDHHPVRPESSAAPYSDVRPEYGACASMIVEFLRASKLEPDRQLATALFYGIQSETMDLGREASKAELDASLYLYPRSDPAALSRIRHARVPRAVYRSIHAGLEQAWSRGGVVCVPAGRLDYPDIVAQLADLFLRVDDVDWVIAAGRYRDGLYLSLRTLNPDAHAGDLVRRVVGDRGSAGGHGEMAGARLDVSRLSADEYDELLSSLFDEFCAELGVADEPRIPLVPPITGGPPQTAGPSGRVES
ncbi:MAG: DHH family phosphoesterase [marine benthic group bacterium]|nr:DHH family phosphoesterase [Candidatus Carthagonibacter metallireducens]MCL7966969.1 DHH family phosphoesterase [Gemmatimonadota bacterium]MCL7975649.1 DHH family phosphoesterase [Gemmatimonadota bacterium]